MTRKSTFRSVSLDDIIHEAIGRENQLKQYYRQALEEVGPDVRELLSDLSLQHDKRINQLNNLLVEIEELRELSSSIAD